MPVIGGWGPGTAGPSVNNAGAGGGEPGNLSGVDRQRAINLGGGPKNNLSGDRGAGLPGSGVYGGPAGVSPSNPGANTLAAVLKQQRILAGRR